MSAERLNLEVPVTFELDDLTVPLESLERLQPGQLFDLPAEITAATVHLKVAGKEVAEGVLVAVGRRLGVRITDVFLVRASQT